MKILARDIQIFVAGILAYIGFQSMVSTFILIFTEGSLFTKVVILLPVFGLPIGLAMFLGKERAIIWARIYLLIYFLLTIGWILAQTLYSPPALRNEINTWMWASRLLAPIILLGLLMWCSSKRFRAVHE